jgi:hypothetical protein
MQARDNGLRKIRKITWRVGLVSAAAAAVIGAKFAHLSAVLPHWPTDGGSSSSSGSSVSGAGTGISSSSGVSSASGSSGLSTSGGS